MFSVRTLVATEPRRTPPITPQSPQGEEQAEKGSGRVQYASDERCDQGL